MKEIKTSDTVKDIRTLDRTANIADRMMNAYIRTKEQYEQKQQTDADSPTDYAEDRATENVEIATRKMVSELQQQGKRLSKKTRQKVKECHVREDTARPERPEAKVEPKKAATASKAYESLFKPQNAEGNPPNDAVHSCVDTHQQKIRTVSDNVGKETKRGVKTAKRGMKQGAQTSSKVVRTGSRGIIKTAERSVKTVEQVSRSALKTTQVTAKATAKSAQAMSKTTQRAAQAARVTARATVTSAKAIVKATVTTVKAMIATVKELIAAIAAGGWAAVLIIVVIILGAAIMGSVFGIFASEKGYDDAFSMPDVVSQINAEFQDKINSIIDANAHDKMVINNDGSDSMVMNWNEVLAVYAVLVATDPENPTEVVTLDDAKIEKLKMVFWDMNSISYSVNVERADTDEKTGESIIVTVLTITVSYKSFEDMINYYDFDADRAAHVYDLLQPIYAGMFQQLTE